MSATQYPLDDTFLVSGGRVFSVYGQSVSIATGCGDARRELIEFAEVEYRGIGTIIIPGSPSSPGTVRATAARAQIA